jgi:adenylate cyclase
MAATRRLAAIFAADVAGYSRLMGADEEGTLERLNAHRRDLVDPKITEHRGRIVKTTGDGLLAEFPSVVDAVRCAAEVQRGMICDLDEDQRIQFRIGINLGDVIVEGDDILGDGVNIAARLEGIADPGGICLSASAHEQVRDKVDFNFADLGDQNLKNIARPVRAYALRPEGLAALPASQLPERPFRRGRAIVGTAAGAALLIVFIAGWFWFWPAATSSSGAGKPTAQDTASAAPMPTALATASISQPLVAPRLSIVVLPFANLTNEAEQQYFADGITEDVTTDLSRIADMFVISRNTAFTYRNKQVDAKQIGRELGVRYVLEGSVQRAGNQVRVNAQLIDAETNAHLWAERFDRDTGNLFALQDEVTNRIAVALNMAVIGAEAARPNDQPDALDYILRGRAAGAKGPARENTDQAVRLFERALALDPRSLVAQGRLAGALAVRVIIGMTDSAAADIARADALISEVLAGSPRDWFAHWVKAQVLRAQGRCADAIPEYETALALNRNGVNALNGLGWCKLYTGSLEEVIPIVEQAIRLSPRDPAIGFWYGTIGFVYLLQSRLDEAIFWLEKARSALPGLPHYYLISAYALRGDTERAAAELAEARRLSADHYPSISRVKAVHDFGVPKIHALFETTYFAGLRKAGVPEE